MCVEVMECNISVVFLRCSIVTYYRVVCVWLVSELCTELLSQVAVTPSFKHWELSDMERLLRIDTALFSQQPHNSMFPSSLSKCLNIRSHKQGHIIAWGLRFFGARNLGEIWMGRLNNGAICIWVVLYKVTDVNDWLCYMAHNRICCACHPLSFACLPCLLHFEKQFMEESDASSKLLI